MELAAGIRPLNISLFIPQNHPTTGELSPMNIESIPLKLALGAGLVLPMSGCLDAEEPGDEIEMRESQMILGGADCDCPTCIPQPLPRSCWGIRDFTIGISLLQVDGPAISEGIAMEAQSEVSGSDDMLITLDVSPMNYVTLTMSAEDMDFDGERFRTTLDLSGGTLHPTFGKAMSVPLKNFDVDTLEQIAEGIDDSASMSIAGAGQPGEMFVIHHDELHFLHW